MPIEVSSHRTLDPASRDAVAKLRLDGTPTPRSLGGSDDEAADPIRCGQERLGSRGLNKERAMNFATRPVAHDHCLPARAVMGGKHVGW